MVQTSVGNLASNTVGKVVMSLIRSTSKQSLKLMVAKSSNSWDVRTVFIVMNTLMQALKLSVVNVSGNTRMPGAPNGNFR